MVLVFNSSFKNLILLMFEGKSQLGGYHVILELLGTEF